MLLWSVAVLDQRPQAVTIGSRNSDRYPVAHASDSHALTAGEILRLELDALIAAMQTAAPSLSAENAEQIAYGSICEWIMRCPLDFPNVQ